MEGLEEKRKKEKKEKEKRKKKGADDDVLATKPVTGLALDIQRLEDRLKSELKVESDARAAAATDRRGGRNRGLANRTAPRTTR